MFSTHRLATHTSQRSQLTLLDAPGRACKATHCGTRTRVLHRLVAPSSSSTPHAPQSPACTCSCDQLALSTAEESLGKVPPKDKALPCSHCAL
eukprot:g74041.t1